jgi:hypothetical protein
MSTDVAGIAYDSPPQMENFASQRLAGKELTFSFLLSQIC